MTTRQFEVASYTVLGLGLVITLAFAATEFPWVSVRGPRLFYRAMDYILLPAFPFLLALVLTRWQRVVESTQRLLFALWTCGVIATLLTLGSDFIWAPHMMHGVTLLILPFAQILFVFLIGIHVWAATRIERSS